MAVQQFDRSVLKVGQAFIMGVNILAFALGFVFQVQVAWVLAPLVGIIMLLGVFNPEFGLFRQLYLRVLKPRGIVKPRVIQEDATPHQFAQVVGAVFLLAAGVAFMAGAVALGWVLAWIVIALAFINFAFDFCVGCQMYFQLDRMRLIPRRG
jgi:phosphate/sulfate permease